MDSNTSLPLFDDDEKEVFLMLLRRMGDEMKPRGMRRESAKAYDVKVRYASERVLEWLQKLKDNEPTRSEASEDSGAWAGEPDLAG